MAGALDAGAAGALCKARRARCKLAMHAVHGRLQAALERVRDLEAQLVEERSMWDRVFDQMPEVEARLALVAPVVKAGLEGLAPQQERESTEFRSTQEAL